MEKKQGVAIELSTGKFGLSLSEKTADKFATLICETVRSVVGPVTATCDGFSYWIRKWSCQLTEIEALNAVKVWKLVKGSVPNIDIHNESISPKIVFQLLKSSSEYSAEEYQQAWSSLILQEFTEGLHPEFPKILRRLDIQDLRTLFIIQRTGGLNQSALDGIDEGLISGFSLEQLTRLGLIKLSENKYQPTQTGIRFIASAGIEDVKKFQRFVEVIDRELTIIDAEEFEALDSNEHD